MDANRPDERGRGVEPVSKKLQERAAKQWEATWGKETAQEREWREGNEEAGPFNSVAAYGEEKP